jgi:hypothetical protein
MREFAQKLPGEVIKIVPRPTSGNNERNSSEAIDDLERILVEAIDGVKDISPGATRRRSNQIE